MGALLVADFFMGTNNASTVQPIVDVERAVMYRWGLLGLLHPCHSENQLLLGLETCTNMSGQSNLAALIQRQAVRM